MKSHIRVTQLTIKPWALALMHRCAPALSPEVGGLLKYALLPLHPNSQPPRCEGGPRVWISSKLQVMLCFGSGATLWESLP